MAKKGIRINSVNPGVIEDTPLFHTSGLSDEAVKVGSVWTIHGMKQLES